MMQTKIEELLKGVQKNVVLAPYTTFKIGGPAQYFYIAKTKENLIRAIIVAKKFNLPFFIWGGGSKILVSDEGFTGLVIKNSCLNFQFKQGDIFAEAGTKLEDLVDLSLEGSLTGLEWAAGIPGTVGGAIRGNAEAFDGFMSNIVIQVETFDCLTSEVKQFKNQKCQFGTKNSIFKQNKNLIILSAQIRLKKGSQEESKAKVKEYLDLREDKHPLDFPSAGCIFINPLDAPAGLLIDKCGLKGKTIGGAQISEKHANFIINTGGATANDVRQLIELIKKQVKKKFGIELKEEIQYLGFDI